MSFCDPLHDIGPAGNSGPDTDCYSGLGKCVMRLLAFCSLGFASPALACDTPICLTDPEQLGLSRVITFDDQPSSFGVGYEIKGLLQQPGATFGERFAGQSLHAEGHYDRVKGTPYAPLTVLPGAPGQTLGILRLMGTSVLHGHGPAGFPSEDAAGEGAVAVVFHSDQGAVAFDIRGGEDGFAQVHFLRRDGSEIHSLRLGPLRETSYGFVRQNDIRDIAGLFIVNSDPQGIALDNLAFDRTLVLGLLQD